MQPDPAKTYSAIVLAAGLGSRFGGGKLLAPFGKDCVLAGALRAAFAAPVQEVILVTGAGAREVEAAARSAIPLSVGANLRVVHAPDYRSGMAASLRAGLAAVPEMRAGAFIFLGDMPRVPHLTADRLAEKLTDAHLAAAPVFECQRGHPVLVRRALFARISALDGDCGAGAILGALGPALLQISEPDRGIIFDVDRPDDLDSGRALTDMEG